MSTLKNKDSYLIKIIQEVFIIIFFAYFIYLCWIFNSRFTHYPDFTGVFDNMWYFYHRLSQGSFPQWNPFFILGRMSIQWNQLPVSLFTPYLLFSEFTLEKYKVITIGGTFLSFLSIYCAGRISGYNKFVALIPVLLFATCGRYLASVVFVGSTTSFFLFPIALAILFTVLNKDKNNSWRHFLPFAILFSFSFLGTKTEDIIYKSSLVLISFSVFGIYQLPDKNKMKKFFLFGLGAITLMLLTNAWQLSFLLNAVFDNPRVSMHTNILKLFDPLFLKWIIKSLIYQAPIVLSIINIVIYFVLKKWKFGILLKKTSTITFVSFTLLELILLGLMYKSEKIGFHLYWLSNNPEYFIKALSFETSAIIVILFSQILLKEISDNRKFLISLIALFAGCYIAQITIFIWYNTPSFIVGRLIFLFIIAGTYSFAIRKKKPWLILTIVIYLLVGETGIYFLNDIIGIPWMSIRANIALIPYLTILILEGVSFLIHILIRFIAILAKKINKQILDSIVQKIVINCVSILCVFISFYSIKTLFIPGDKQNYYGTAFFETTSINDVKKNMKNKNAYEGYAVYEAYTNTKFVQSHYKEQDHFKRIFVGNIIEDWLNAVEYNYKFLPSFSQRLNTVGLYNSDIPKNMAHIFHEIYNTKLTVHPEFGFQQHFVQYKYADIQKRGESINADFGSWVTIKPNIHNNPLYKEILAREDSKTPRVFLSDAIMKFNNYNDEYNYLKNDIAMKGVSLTNILTTSDENFDKIIKNQNNENLVYSIQFKKDEPELIEIEMSSNKEAYFVLLDSYSKGWKAYVDEKETSIYKAYIGTRFINAPAGKHIIRFTYAVPGFQAAYIISIISWIFVFFFIVINFRKSNEENRCIEFEKKDASELFLHSRNTDLLIGGIKIKEGKNMKFKIAFIFAVVGVLLIISVVISRWVIFKQEDPLSREGLLSKAYAVWTMDDGVGDKIKDMKSTHDAISGNTVTIEGHFSNARYFNGKDSYIQTPVNFKGWKAISISFWVKPERKDGNELSVILDNGHDAKNNFAIQSADFSGKKWVWHCNGRDILLNLTLNEWNHVVVVC